MVHRLFALVVLLHGLIHLMGFVKAFRLADLTQLSADITKPVGIVWLTSAVLLVLAGIGIFFGIGWWWVLGAVGVVLSQTLIVMSWHDARYGSIANSIILIGVILAFAAWNFQSMVASELVRNFPPVAKENGIITDAMLDDVPPVVGRWLRHAKIVGKERVTAVHLHQTGAMRTSRDGTWMPFAAEQWFRTEDPRFLWIVNVAMTSWMDLAGRDLFVGGKGNMLIKVLSLVPVADSKGEAIDQGSMVRYFAETIWFPTAALERNIRWEEIDSLTARGRFQYNGKEVSGVFRFNAAGDVLSFEAMRYYDRKEGATLEQWFVQMDPDGYREFEGIRIPARSAVSWRLKDGEYTWLKLELTDVQFNANAN